MKKHLLSQAFYLIIAIALGCTREVNVQVAGPVVQEGQVGGKIVLPAGSKVDTVGLKVLSALTSITPVNSGYSVDTAGKTSTTLLMNKAGEVLLMGYNYPGQSDANLSPESTALAMLMNTLTMSSLTTEGKLDAIIKIKAEPAYTKFADEVSETLRAGKSVTDTNNVALFQAMALVFKNATNLRVAATQSYAVPITIKTANTELLLQNSYVSNTYVAGIYKDGKNLKRLTIKGRRIFATSLADIAAGFSGGGYGIPDPVFYSMTGDGEYSVVIRSGKPFSGDESEESILARRENVHYFILDLLLDHLPIPAECVKATTQGVVDVTKGLFAKKEALLNNAKSPEVFAAVALELTGEVFEHSNEVAENCAKLSDDTFSFLKGIGRLFKAISIASKLFVGGNIMSHTNDLFQAKSAMDTCFQVVGLKTFKCGDDLSYKIQIVSGNTQKGEFGKALTSPLTVKVADKDGKAADKADVNWTVKTGGGTLSTLKSITNSQGLAEVIWTLGKENSSQEVTASVNKTDKIKTVSFLATAAPGVATKVEIVSGNDQSAKPTEAVSSPLIIKVMDQFGNPVPKMQVDWQVKQGGGSFLFTNNLTNDEGTASANWILGKSGAQMVEVIVKNKDGNYLSGAPLRFEGSLTTSKSAELIIGKWQNVRTYGVLEDGKPYDNPENEGVFTWTFSENNNVIEEYKDNTNDKYNYQDTYIYIVNEPASELIIKDYYSDPDDFVAQIKILEKDYMLLYRLRNGVNSQTNKPAQYTEYTEYKRVSNSGRISPLKVGSYKKTPVRLRPGSNVKRHSLVRGPK